MYIIKAHILTTWTPEHTYDIQRLCQPGASIMDVCGTPLENVPPDPNVIVVECWLSARNYNTILDHPDYGEGAVLWSEVIEDGI